MVAVGKQGVIYIGAGRLNQNNNKCSASTEVRNEVVAYHTSILLICLLSRRDHEKHLKQSQELSTNGVGLSRRLELFFLFDGIVTQFIIS